MKSAVSNKLIAVVSIVFFLGVLAINSLANTTIFGGRTTGAVADAIPNLFVPAGLTFSIWGVIYLLLIAFVAYQTRWLFSADERRTARLRPIGILFIITCALNIGWLLAWQYSLVGLSVVIMLAFLATLILAYLRLRAGSERPRWIEYVFVRLPFSVYLGWISVATIANVTALLVTLGWNGFGASQAFWTVLMIGIALALALTVLFSRRDPAYALVFVWAFLGVYIKRTASGVPFVPEVAYAALAACLVAAAAATVIFGLNLSRIPRR
ncbi:MAG: tryptophan-rich sensory protein [Spirochaetales bacterium]|nr:tryptophan-rich sensory protein [Spirochaetales bacterium]